VKTKHTNQNVAKIVVRWVTMLLGLVCASFGISFSLKAELGTSALSSCPAVFHAPIGITVGTALFLMCALFLVAQIVIARKDFPPFQLLQLLLIMAFGKLIDLANIVLTNVNVQALPFRISFCALGILLLAFGMFLMLKAQLLMPSPDAMYAMLAKRYGIDYSKIKIIIDCIMVAIATVGTLLINQELVNVGIGTIAAAVLVGAVIKLFSKIKPLNGKLEALTQ